MSPYLPTISNQITVNGTLVSNGFNDLLGTLRAENANGKLVGVAAYLSAMSPYLPTISGQLEDFYSMVSGCFSNVSSALYARNVDGKSIGVAGYLSAISPYFPTISNQITTNGTLVSNGFNDLLGTLRAPNVDGKSIGVAGYLSAMSPYLPTISNQITTNGTLVSGGFGDVNKSLTSSLQWQETLHDDLSMLRHGVADLLPGYADWTVWDFLQGIYIDLGNVVDLLKGLQQTLTAWGERWDSQDQYLMEWAKRWDALDKSPADLSEINTLLGRLTADVASIRDKYVLDEALGSILDVLVGDLQTPHTQAVLSSIQDVMATRFPFCIPSLVNAVLFGSILADAAPPVWEFDIAGSPLVVDFSEYAQFAEVCRWTVLLLFTASLLLNTRRFIYGMGGGVE